MTIIKREGNPHTTCPLIRFHPVLSQLYDSVLSTTSPEPASASVPLMFIFTFRRDISFCSFVLGRIGVFTVIKYIIMPLSIGQHMKCVDVCVEGGGRECLTRAKRDWNIIVCIIHRHELRRWKGKDNHSWL